MRKLTSEELKHVQLEVLQDFHDFCIGHKLSYSLCGGTLLGAIRHKGFIPWDDDIDVMMPRKDYQIFLALYNSNKNTLYHFSKQKNYYYPFAKLSDNTTLIKNESAYKICYGVNIDIFPLDFFPNSMIESERWSKRLGVLKDIGSVKVMRFSRSRPICKNIFLALLKCLACPIPMKWLIRRIDKLAQKYYRMNDGFLGNMTNGYRMKERNPMAKFLIDVDFEGRKYKAIENYDIYLKSLYGNYMQLPPKNHQVPHHSFEAYWK